MLKRITAALALAVALVLSMSLIACKGPKATGYMGKLEDGMELIYIELEDGTIIASLTDAQHTEENADTYSGKATPDADGKITVTDEESGRQLVLTMTKGADDTFDVDVEGHGKGTLKPYEGDLLDIITSMATDDTQSK